MGPGPSDVHPTVLAALARPTIGHLDPKFVELMDEVKSLLQYAFQTTNRLTMPVSGPGTAGMESCFANLVEPGTTVIVCRNGVFGERMRQMVERCGGIAVMVDDAWGRAVDPNKAEAALKNHPEAEIFAFIHAETSTGALSDANELARLAQKHDCLTIMDAVTSLGGIPVRVDEWGIDAAYSGTQKCLSVPPGLSPISFSERATARVTNRKTPVQSWFMDVALVMGYWGEGKRAYHHTAPINMIYALHEGLLRLNKEGLESAWERHWKMHEALKFGLEALGFTYLAPEGERLPQLNAVWVPEDVDEASARGQLLAEHNLEIGGGLGDLAGKVWRIGLMGYASRAENVRKCLAALETVLGRSGGLIAAENHLNKKLM